MSEKTKEQVASESGWGMDDLYVLCVLWGSVLLLVSMIVVLS